MELDHGMGIVIAVVGSLIILPVLFYSISIAELIRERLKEEDLANAVTAGASAAEKIAQHDD